MRDSRGVTGLIFGVTGVALAYLVDTAWRANDGVNSMISPAFAQLLSLLPTQEAPKGFSSLSGVYLTEEIAIWVVGGVSVMLGITGIILSLLSIRRHEDVRISFAALSMGSGPVIMLSLVAGLFLLIVAGLTAVLSTRSVEKEQ